MRKRATENAGALSSPGALTYPEVRPQQMDNAVYTFETLLHQELGKGPTKEELCKSIQRILERVLKVSRQPGPAPCAEADTEARVRPGAPWSPLTRSPRFPLSRQKYDYDSSSVRKRFFREALLQITIPFLLKKLAPTCKSVSAPRPHWPSRPAPALGPTSSPDAPLSTPTPALLGRSCPGSRS